MERARGQGQYRGRSGSAMLYLAIEAVRELEKKIKYR